MYRKVKRSVELAGKSQITLTNYSRCLAHMTLHFTCSPLVLDEEQVLDYLHLLKSQHNTPSDSFFKHTVYGLRYAYRISGMKEMRVILPSIEQPRKGKPGCRRARYLFPVKAMSKVFRARFVASLRKELPSQSTDFYKSLFKHHWVVYCKLPFFGPTQVVEYLGRYTHKIAINNHRIKNLDSKGVTFSVKDYRHGGRKSLLRLSDAEFIRRFALHILPKGFVRIRHYGILSSYHKKISLPALQAILGTVQLKEKGPLQHVVHQGSGWKN